MIRIVQYYKIYFNNNSFIDFVKNKNIEYDIFWFYKDKSKSRFLNKNGSMFLNKREIVIREFRNFFLLLIKFRSFRKKKIICFGGQYSLMLFTKLFGLFLGSEYHLYLYNFYIHKLGKKKIIKIILRLLLSSKKTTLIVQSPGEVEYFNSFSKNIVHFIPYCEAPLNNVYHSTTFNGDYLFTGGYTNRDYELVLECARQNRQVKFMMVVSKLNKNVKREELPDNVILYEEVDFTTFRELMFNSLGVIIPLKENVGASGQMLCVGAMKMAKPIIYSDVSSINYYFEENDCGIPYKLGDINSLNSAVNMLFSPDFDRDSMRRKAYSQFFEKYNINKRDEKLLNIISQK